MKRLKLFLLMLVIIITSGCARINYNMSISLFKKMDISLLYSFDKELLKEENLLEKYTDVIDKDKLEILGYTVTDYNEDGYKGFRANLKVNSIDNVSKEDEVDINIIDTLQIAKEKIYYFQVKKSFFKNTYRATYRINDYNNNDGNSDNANVIFELNLPMKALDNNATEVTNDGKTLSWDYNKLSDKKIEFEFEIYNMGALISVICAGIALLLLIMISLKSTKKDEEMVTNYETNEEKNKLDDPMMTNIETI